MLRLPQSSASPGCAKHDIALGAGEDGSHHFLTALAPPKFSAHLRGGAHFVITPQAMRSPEFPEGSVL